MSQPPYPPQPPYGPPPGYPQQPQGYYPPPPPGQPYGQPYPPPRKGGSGWIIVLVVILGCVVFFGGTLAVMAIYGVRKYIANAKTVEARNSLGAIARDASVAFERDRRLCPSASRSVPDSVVKVSGKKYLSSSTEWQADASRHGGFACLGFSLTMPQYFMYSYKAQGSRAVGDGFEATAVGDLNGDGHTSLFKITGTVAAGGIVTIAPNLFEQDPEE
jgi:type IV pilus assembly protein PilA